MPVFEDLAEPLDDMVATSDWRVFRLSRIVQQVAHAAAVQVGSQPVELQVLLAGASRLTGTVRATGSGSPVADARVTLVDGEGSTIGTTLTGPDGAYSFENLLEGEYTVSASGYPPVASRLTVAAGQQHTHDVQLGYPEG